MSNWQAIGLKAWRGALIGAAIGLVGGIPILAVLLFLDQPVLAGLALYFCEGVILGAATGAVHEWMRQRGLQP